MSSQVCPKIVGLMITTGPKALMVTDFFVTIQVKFTRHGTMSASSQRPNESFQERVLTEDKKTWIHFIILETKQYSSVWGAPIVISIQQVKNSTICKKRNGYAFFFI